MNRNRKTLITLIVAAFVAFFINTGVLMVSLEGVIDKNVSQMSQFFAEKIYDDIEMSLVEPISVSDMMSCDQLLRRAIREGREGEISKYLDGIHDRFRYSSVFYADVSSKKYYSYNSRAKDIHEGSADSKWFFDFIANDSKRACNLNINKENNDLMTIFINNRVEDERGRIIGVCGVGVALYDMQKRFISYTKEYQVDVCLMDENGDVRIENGNPIDETILTKAKANKNKSGELVFLNKTDSSACIMKYIPEIDWTVIVNREIEVKKLYEPVMYSNAISFIVLTLALVGLFYSMFASERTKLKKRIATDAMTGLYNKPDFLREVDTILETKNRDIGFVFADLDNFKNVNDILGHITGDLAIMDAAEHITLNFRDSDLKARFGGDEFLVFMTGIPRRVLEEKTNEMLTGLRNTYTDGVNRVRVTASIGVLYISDARGYTAEELLRRADEACYEVKHNGKNGFIIKDM